MGHAILLFTVLFIVLAGIGWQTHKDHWITAFMIKTTIVGVTLVFAIRIWWENPFITVILGFLWFLWYCRENPTLPPGDEDNEPPEDPL